MIQGTDIIYLFFHVLCVCPHTVAILSFPPHTHFLNSAQLLT